MEKLKDFFNECFRKKKQKERQNTNLSGRKELHEKSKEWFAFKIKHTSEHWWLMLIIPGTWEAEIRRIMV
jgi:hypothetical protein